MGERILFTRWSPELDASSLVGDGVAPPPTTQQTLAAAMAAAAAKAKSGDDSDTPLARPLPVSLERVCLLDMDAEEPLRPDDVSKVDAVVFGGILGNVIENEDG